MRSLLPLPVVEDVDLHAWYAQDWVGPGGLRVNFVSSVDGAATAGGVSKGLQTPGDNSVFAALRDLADAVVVGAGTARAEGYRAVQVSARRRAIRERFGLPEQVPTAVVSRALHLDPTAELFTGAPPGGRTVVLTCAAADPNLRHALAEVADVITCGADEVDLGLARAALEERGLSRLLCEGGPSLFSDLARAGVVDELCLSMTPLLAGPGARRIVAGTPWEDEHPRELRLSGLLEQDGALFCRYRC